MSLTLTWSLEASAAGRWARSGRNRASTTSLSTGARSWWAAVVRACRCAADRANRSSEVRGPWRSSATINNSSSWPTVSYWSPPRAMIRGSKNVDPGTVPGPVEPDPGHPFAGGFDDPGDRVVFGVPVQVPFPVEAADLPSGVDRVLDVVVLHIAAFGDADIADQDDVDRLHHVPVVQHERVRPDIHAGLFVDPGRAAAERWLGPDQGRVGRRNLPGR